MFAGYIDSMRVPSNSVKSSMARQEDGQAAPFGELLELWVKEKPRFRQWIPTGGLKRVATPGHVPEEEPRAMRLPAEFIANIENHLLLNALC